MLTIKLLQIDELPSKPQREKTKIIEHHLVSRIASGKKMRRKCSACYSKHQKEMGRSEARKKSKEVFTYCEACPDLP